MGTSQMLGEDIDSWETMMFLYNSALKEVGTKLEILNDEFVHIHKYNPIEYIKSRIKTPESIVKKLKRLIMRGMTPITRRNANVPAETAMPQAVARPAIKMCLRNIVFMPLSSRVLYKRHIDILFILSHLNLNRCRI